MVELNFETFFINKIFEIIVSTKLSEKLLYFILWKIPAHQNVVIQKNKKKQNKSLCLESKTISRELKNITKYKTQKTIIITINVTSPLGLYNLKINIVLRKC